MRFRNVKIDVPNIEYSDLNYDLQEKIADDLMYPIKDGYDNYIDVEIVCYLGDTFYTTEAMVRDLKRICDLTNKQFDKLVKNKEEVSFYVSYEL